SRSRRGEMNGRRTAASTGQCRKTRSCQCMVIAQGRFGKGHGRGGEVAMSKDPPRLLLFERIEAPATVKLPDRSVRGTLLVSNELVHSGCFGFPRSTPALPAPCRRPPSRVRTAPERGRGCDLGAERSGQSTRASRPARRRDRHPWLPASRRARCAPRLQAFLRPGAVLQRDAGRLY